MSKKIKYQFGTVSAGTMNEEHLAPRFLDCLADFAPRRANKLRREWASLQDTGSDEEREEHNEEQETQADARSEFVHSLFDELDRFAAPYCYFGAHPGDGSDYGFWLSEGWEQDLIDNGGLKVADLAQVPKGFTGEVCQVSDHGNPTLYRFVNGRAYQVWALV